jgi:large subunit ribosomal protein L15
VKLNELAPAPGARSKRKRVGRGPGSGHGRRSTRGNKGQKARNKVSPWFEGGQMPLQRRLPKRGFKNPGRETYEVVNLKDIADRFAEGEEVNAESLKSKNLVRKGSGKIKILAHGELDFPVKVAVQAVSKKAKELLEKAGGTVTIVE